MSTHCNLISGILINPDWSTNAKRTLWILYFVLVDSLHKRLNTPMVHGQLCWYTICYMRMMVLLPTTTISVIVNFDFVTRLLNQATIRTWAQASIKQGAAVSIFASGFIRWPSTYIYTVLTLSTLSPRNCKSGLYSLQSGCCFKSYCYTFGRGLKCTLLSITFDSK